MKVLFRPSSIKARKYRKAFTLVETVIALGITAFAMLGILGMVPFGLNHLHEAMSTTAESQIVQGIRNDLRLTSYSAVISDYHDKTNKAYYNDEGILLQNEDAPSKAFEVIVNSVDLVPPASSAADASTEAWGQTVRIEVRKVGSAQASKRYSFIVPKN